jgi:hypothetical protein
VDFGTGQRLVWENKLAKGFSTDDVPLEFCLLQSEVAEAFEAKIAKNAARRYRALPNGAFVMDEPDGQAGTT